MTKSDCNKRTTRPSSCTRVDFGVWICLDIYLRKQLSLFVSSWLLLFPHLQSVSKKVFEVKKLEIAENALSLQCEMGVKG